MCRYGPASNAVAATSLQISNFSIPAHICFRQSLSAASTGSSDNGSAAQIAPHAFSARPSRYCRGHLMSKPIEWSSDSVSILWSVSTLLRADAICRRIFPRLPFLPRCSHQRGPVVGRISPREHPGKDRVRIVSARRAAERALVRPVCLRCGGPAGRSPGSAARAACGVPWR